MISGVAPAIRPCFNTVSRTEVYSKYDSMSPIIFGNGLVQVFVLGGVVVLGERNPLCGQQTSSVSFLMAQVGEFRGCWRAKKSLSGFVEDQNMFAKTLLKRPAERTC
eukprot:3714771-Pleurochrysis_carterae.AAC.2